MIGDKLALSGTIVRKTGDGLIDGTWTDAGLTMLVVHATFSDDQRFELYLIEAPQRHGQNLYKQNISTYSQELAGDIDGYDETALEMRSLKLKSVGSSTKIGTPVDESYKGQQYWYMYGEGGLFGGGLQDRQIGGLLNERENFFHKPLVNLNHFYDVNDQVRLSSILYWSGGSGGGTGTYGSVKRLPTVEL